MGVMQSNVKGKGSVLFFYFATLALLNPIHGLESGKPKALMRYHLMIKKKVRSRAKNFYIWFICFAAFAEKKLIIVPSIPSADQISKHINAINYSINQTNLSFHPRHQIILFKVFLVFEIKNSPLS